LLRGFQIRPRLANLQADSRFRSRLLRSGTTGHGFALRYLCLVRAPFEQIPAETNRNQPVLAAAIRKSLAVGFEGSVQSYLRQIVSVGIRRLKTCDLRGKPGLARFRSAVDCVPLVTAPFRV
jgi:hypothetical protein